ncbi:MAG: SDR family NAD(P)-dependent oxidoreductase [Halarchaeum sp.]
MARTAVIAGVGSGLGESLARKFAAEGCRVALFARSTAYIEDLAADLPDPGEGLAVPVDLTDTDAVRAGFETVRAEFGSIDVLVNHASAASWTGLMGSTVETFLDPERMAETYWHLVTQDDPSTQSFEVHVTNGPQTTEFLWREVVARVSVLRSPARDLAVLRAARNRVTRVAVVSRPPARIPGARRRVTDRRGGRGRSARARVRWRRRRTNCRGDGTRRGYRCLRPTSAGTVDLTLDDSSSCPAARRENLI